MALPNDRSLYHNPADEKRSLGSQGVAAGGHASFQRTAGGTQANGPVSSFPAGTRGPSSDGSYRGRPRAAPPKAGSRNYRYCATLNNPTTEEFAALDQAKTDPRIKFLVYQSEVAPSSGTPHLQIYFELFTAKTLTACKRAFDWLQRAHIEVALGSRADNQAYCTKQSSRAAGTEPTLVENKGQKEQEEQVSVATLLARMQPDQRLDYNIGSYFGPYMYWLDEQQFIDDIIKTCSDPQSYLYGWKHERSDDYEIGHLQLRAYVQKKYGVTFPIKFNDLKNHLISTGDIDKFKYK